MQSAMVTGRMSEKKKSAGNAILREAGMTASQAINILYSKIINDKSVAILEDGVDQDPIKWNMAASFVDSIPQPFASRFDSMTDAEIRMERLRARGLI